MSAYPQMESTVSVGKYSGKSLSELVSILGETLMGRDLTKRFGNEFPLLIKYIDAKQKLSVQVHPSDELALRQGNGKVGKTEMWYGLKSAPDATLSLGLKNQLTPDTYKLHVENHTIVDDMAVYKPKEGDCFFITAGRIHTIGAGCNLLEIQQTSDITYRIYDYERRDANGNLRELHTELAAESIDYTVLADYETHYERKVNAPMDLIKCPYFTTQAYKLTEDGKVTIDWSEKDAFLVVIVTNGAGKLVVDGEEVDVKEQDTILLPATTKQVAASGAMTFITATV